MTMRAPINLAPLALATVTLGVALQVRDGLYSPLAVALLAISTGVVVLAFIPKSALNQDWTDSILAIGLLFQLGLLYTDFPGSHHHVHARREYWPFLAIVSTAVVATIVLIANRRAARVGLMLFIAIYLSAGVWLLRFTREPLMDVFAFQRDSCEAIVRGINPYALTFPNLYGPAGEWVYGPGLVKDGRLLFGFPYMPVTLGMELVGHLIFRDYRYALLLAVAGAALLIGWKDASRRGALCAAVLLFTPRGFYVVEQGWCEPLVVLLLCATVVAAERWPRVAAILFGLLVAAKQYDLFMVPLGLMLVPAQTPWPRIVRFFLVGLCAAVVATIPVMLWDVHAFWESAVMLQFRQPFRADSLSFAALIANVGGPRIGVWPSILAVIIAIAFCLRRIMWHPAGFAIAVAVSYLAFFAFSKQAFANYYFLVIAAPCCGIARAEAEARANRFTSPPPNVR